MTKKFHLPVWAGIMLFFLVLLLLYLPHFSKLGVMTPWEMDRASLAIELATNQSKPWMAVQHIDSEGDVAPMPLWTAALGYKWFGISEAAGRIPTLILFFFALLTMFWSVARLIGLRAAYFSTLVLAVFPLTASQVFQTGGYGVSMSCLTVTFAALALARWLPIRDASGKSLLVEKIAALVVGLAGLAGGYFSIGGIVGLLLPAATLAVAQLATGDWRIFVPGRFREWLREEGVFSAALSILFLAALVVLVIIIAPVAKSKEPEFNLLAGGTPRLGAVPTIDTYIEHIAFGTYPWAALLPAGMAALMLPGVLSGKGLGQDRISPPRIFFLTANFFGFAAINFFAFRYVNIPYIVLLPAAVACGTLLSDLERAEASWKIVGMIACLLLLLFMRDLHLYPNSLAELWVSPTLKDAYPVKMIPRGSFALFTLVFMTVLFYVFLLGSRKVEFLEWFGSELGIIKAFRGRYGRTWKIVFWCMLAAWVVIVLSAAFIILKVPVRPFNVFTSIARKVICTLALLPVFIVIGDFGFRLAYNALASVQIFRVDILAAAGFVFGYWFCNGYMPVVARNLAPTAAVDFYKKHSGPGDELLTYRVSAGIGKFYGIKKVRQITSQTAFINEINSPKKIFLLYGREDNPSLDLAYKEKEHDHIYVPEADTWRFLLASNKIVPGVKQHNPIRDIVRMAPPEPEYHVYANLDNKVEYLGYDLQTDHEGDWAGALEHFTFTSYWHCTDKVPGSYKFFIHVDGFGLRLNGDHEPLDELYPTRYWRTGDYLVDVYRMQVPIHFRAGDYTIYIGLFQGDDRLKQVAGPTSGDDRIQGGILKVR
jgi:hypothetical protein